MFSTLSKTNFQFSVTFSLSSANAFSLDQSKLLSRGKGVKEFNSLTIAFQVLKVEIVWSTLQPRITFCRCPVYDNLPSPCTLQKKPGECCDKPVCNGISFGQNNLSK